jgi:hypothetical protein
MAVRLMHREEALRPTGNEDIVTVRYYTILIDSTFDKAETL